MESRAKEEPRYWTRVGNPANSAPKTFYSGRLELFFIPLKRPGIDGKFDRAKFPSRKLPIVHAQRWNCPMSYALETAAHGKKRELIILRRKKTPEKYDTARYYNADINITRATSEPQYTPPGQTTGESVVVVVVVRCDEGASYSPKSTPPTPFSSRNCDMGGGFSELLSF